MKFGPGESQRVWKEETKWNVSKTLKHELVGENIR